MQTPLKIPCGIARLRFLAITLCFAWAGAALADEGRGNDPTGPSDGDSEPFRINLTEASYHEEEGVDGTIYPIYREVYESTFTETSTGTPSDWVVDRRYSGVEEWAMDYLAEPDSWEFYSQYSPSRIHARYGAWDTRLSGDSGVLRWRDVLSINEISGAPFEFYFLHTKAEIIYYSAGGYSSEIPADPADREYHVEHFVWDGETLTRDGQPLPVPTGPIRFDDGPFQYGTAKLLKVDVEIHDENGNPQIATEDDPANVPVNGDFDEEKQVNGRYVRDYEDANLEFATDSNDLKTDDLRGCVVDIPGFTDDVWQNTTLKIRKKPGVIDPLTDEEEAGEIRIHAIDGSNNWVEVPLDTDLAPDYYVSTGQYADYDSCWIEGIKDGPITIEVEVVINGGTPITVEKKAMICTEKTKAEWLQELRDEMELLSDVDMNQFNPSNGFLPNRSYLQAVYFYYEELFVRDLDYVWPGMAKMAGAPVYGGLSDAEYGDNVFTIQLVIAALGLGSGVEEVNLTNLSTIQTTLIGVNKAIYEDLDWQFKAYHTSGLCALEHTYLDAGSDDSVVEIDVWRAFRAAEESDYSLIQAANRDLLLREQSEIVVPGWNTIANLSLVRGSSSSFMPAKEVFSILAENPIPGGNDFRDVVPGGDITDFDDRWTWIDDSSQGMWKLWTDFSIVQQRGYVETSLTTRAADYAWLPVQ